MKQFKTTRELRESFKRMDKKALNKAMEIATDAMHDFRLIASTVVPRNQGELANSIRARKHRYGYVITAQRISHTGFDVAQFTDKRIPVVDTSANNRFFGKGQSFYYGDASVVSPNGKPIKWTGLQSEGWWTFTAKEVDRLYRVDTVFRRIGTQLM